MAFKGGAHCALDFNGGDALEMFQGDPPKTFKALRNIPENSPVPLDFPWDPLPLGAPGDRWKPVAHGRFPADSECSQESWTSTQTEAF